MLDLNKEFIITNDKIVSVRDFYNALAFLEIKKYDIVCVHSQIFSLGKPLVGKDEFMQIIVNVLQDIISTEGMLIMPTFTYSFCKNEIYDVYNSPSTVGILTEYFRNLSDVLRTEHPIFSFALWGDRKKLYSDIGLDAFGMDSVYGKMILDKGKLLMIGADKGYTFYYLAEEYVNVKHRYFKNFQGSIRNKAGYTYSEIVPYFVRDLSKRSELDENLLSDYLLENECQKKIDFGKGTLSVTDCNKAFYLLACELGRDENRFLKE